MRILAVMLLAAMSCFGIISAFSFVAIPVHAQGSGSSSELPICSVVRDASDALTYQQGNFALHVKTTSVSGAFVYSFLWSSYISADNYSRPHVANTSIFSDVENLSIASGQITADRLHFVSTTNGTKTGEIMVDGFRLVPSQVNASAIKSDIYLSNVFWYLPDQEGMSPKVPKLGMAQNLHILIIDNCATGEYSYSVSGTITIGELVQNAVLLRPLNEFPIIGSSTTTTKNNTTTQIIGNQTMVEINHDGPNGSFTITNEVISNGQTSTMGTIAVNGQGNPASISGYGTHNGFDPLPLILFAVIVVCLVFVTIILNKRPLR